MTDVKLLEPVRKEYQLPDGKTLIIDIGKLPAFDAAYLVLLMPNSVGELFLKGLERDKYKQVGQMLGSCIDVVNYIETEQGTQENRTRLINELVVNSHIPPGADVWIKILMDAYCHTTENFTPDKLLTTQSSILQTLGLSPTKISQGLSGILSKVVQQLSKS